MNSHELKEGTLKLFVSADEICSEPTRVCAVCGTYEFKSAISYYTRDKFWLCPECLKRLKKLLDKENKE